MDITKGKWEVATDKICIKVDDILYVPNKGTFYGNKMFEARANAKLIAEAGTVANETGKTPRQLADENAELLKCLKKALPTLKKDADGLPTVQYEGAKLAIKRAEGGK